MGEGGPQKADEWNMDLSTLAPGQVVPENSFRRNYIEFFHEPLSLWDLYCDSDKGGGGKKIPTFSGRPADDGSPLQASPLTVTPVLRVTLRIQ